MTETVEMSLDVYAIGNALVDREFSVTDEFLQQCNLQKGTMHLVDVQAQNQLFEWLMQHNTVSTEASGGSAGNTAYAVAALGGTAFYACRVGHDAMGEFYLADMQRAGVQTSPRAQSLGQTGTCLVLVTADAERTMHTHLGISAELSVEQVDPTPLAQAQYLYIEGYLASSPSARQAVQQLRQQARTHGCKLALSLSDPAMVQYCREGLEDLIGDGVDVLFCNAQEALLFAQTHELAVAVNLLLQHAPLAVVTLGSEGALIARADGLRQPVPPQQVLEVLDTNGAGDGFAGGFLYGLSQRFTLNDCGHLGTAVATAIIQQYGPRLPRARYAQILQQMIQP